MVSILSAVKPTSDRQKRFDAAMAEIAVLPEEQQVDALLHFFTAVLNETPMEAIREKRNELMARFANCGCSYETCSTLLEWVDHHVALREQFSARQEAEARRNAKAAGSRPTRVKPARLPMPAEPIRPH